MRKHIILFYLIILSAPCFAQTVTKTVGIVYTAGAPTHVPAAKVGSQVAIDTATWEWYEYSGSAWIASGDRIQSISGCSAPNYTPTKYQSSMVINTCTVFQNGHGPELYKYAGSEWLCLNCSSGTNIYAGSGITLSGTPPDITISNTAPDQTVLLNEGTGIDVAGTYPNFTLTNTSPNIVQTLSLAGSDLSISGGNTVTLPATGITSLNGLTGGTQTFATGTSGTNFNISSSGTAHTFNLPDASASNRGALTSANWTTFNNKVGGSGTAGQIAVFTGSPTIGGDGDFTWDAATNTLLVGSSTALNSNYKMQFAGNATYRNAAFTTNETNNGFLDIRGGTMTGATGATHNLAGINVEGAMVFNTSNQTFTGIRVALTSNATSNQNVRPLDVTYSTTTIGLSRILNSGTGGSDLAVSGNNGAENITIRSPGAGGTAAAIPGVNYRSVAGNMSWNIGAVTSGALSIQTTSSGVNPNAVDGTFFVKDDKVSIGRYSSPLYPATLSVRNGTGYGQFNIATKYTPTGSADPLGNVGDFCWDDNYSYLKTSAGWKRSALSTF